jgi:hypothetical protein
MYCEDAVRRIRAALERFEGVRDYRIRAAHLESLHPHDAVAMAVKGIPAQAGIQMRCAGRFGTWVPACAERRQGCFESRGGATGAGCGRECTWPCRTGM